MSKKLDPRVIRTRRYLREALIELVIEKGYDQVTVQDITDRATLNRATFYLHYRDKNELLLDCATELFDDIWDRTQISKHATTLLDPATANPALLQPIIEHFAEHAAFYRVVLGENGVPAFAETVRQYYSHALHELIARHMVTSDPALLDTLVYFNAAGVLGMFSWWVRNDMPHSPEVMSRYLLDIVSQSLLHFVRKAE